MKILKLADVEANEVDMDGASRVAKQTPISSRDGAPNFSFRVFTIQPQGHTPFHQHPSEHLNYVIAGQGALVDADGAEHPVQTGDFALVLPNEKHQYRNTAEDAPLVLICAVPKEYE